jgi:hypothetical protein
MLPRANYLAYRLLNIESLRKIVRRGCASREGIEMVYVVAIIANGLFATIAYLVVTWIWDD